MANQIIRNLHTQLKRLKNNPEFIEFEIQVSMLQKINISFQSRDEKLSFWINIYNIIALHSYIISETNDPLLSMFGRTPFFNNNKYIINGHEFSLDDIEHGILRAKINHFAEDDTRSLLKVETIDPRIHFVLNCVCRSSPSHIVVNHTNVNECLSDATVKYFEKFAKVNGNNLEIPMIFKWYLDDFGGSKLSLLSYVNNYLQIKGKLDGINIKYIDFNWSSFISPSEFLDE